MKSNLFKDSDFVPDFMKDVCLIAGTDFREEMASMKIDVSRIITHKKGYKEVSVVITSYIREHMNNIRVGSDEKEDFNKTYKWLKDKKDDQNIRRFFLN